MSGESLTRSRSLRAVSAEIARLRDDLHADLSAVLAHPRGGVRASLPVLVALAVACGFIALYFLARLAGDERWLEPPLAYLMIDRDHSVPEFLEYGAILVSALSLMTIARRRDASFLRVLGFVYLWVLAENALRIHETVSKYMGFTYKFDAELVYFLVTGALFAALVLAALVRQRFRIPSLGYVNLLVIGSLAGFAVAVDYAHGRFGHLDETLNVVLGGIEDGGEMITLVLGASYNALVHAAGDGRDGHGRPGGRG